MKILGIVSEYNPFHLGHYYQLQESRKITGADGVIAIMSGSITQRGEFSLFNKWERARLALESGIDLVIELPVIYSGQSAETFATGAIHLLESSGVCTHLSFGSESGNLNDLLTLSDLLAHETHNFKIKLKSFLDLGYSFAKARELSVEQLLGLHYSEHLKKPNNILAIEYLKALKRSNSKIQPVTIQRRGADYHSLEDSSILSATGVRKIISDYQSHQNLDTILNALDKKLPYQTDLLIPMIENINFSGNQKLLDLLRYTILGESVSSLRQFPYVSEGLEHKIRDAIKIAPSLNDLINDVVSKRIPQTRVQRIFTNRLMNLTKSDLANLKNTKPYLRVLGFNRTGQVILKSIKQKEQAPLINNLRKEINRLTVSQKSMLHFDICSTDLQNLLFEKKYCFHRDFFTNPLQL
ncbi:nucleotidyltransferase [Eubacteriaceae bacterium ES3]|nr:nucleotidyltransferase [Eubacteriaceae bacterium ES3]